MKEYIDREAVYAEIEKGDLLIGNNAEWAKEIVHRTPTADVVEVRHGHWKYNPGGMDWGLGAWECSLCRCRNDNLPMDEKINPRIWAGSKFCPNCGAKMDGERKEQE